MAVKEGKGPRPVVIIAGTGVIVLALLLAGSLLLANVSTLISWVRSDRENEPSEPLSIIVRADASEDALLIEVLSGSVNWTDYIVSSNGLMVQTNVTNSTEGELVRFLGNSYEMGDQVDVSVMERDTQRTVWQATVTARP